MEQPRNREERQKADGLRLLSLDGGGIRGLSALYISKKLMKRIDPINLPKPCEQFDMIAGTGTGGYVLSLRPMKSTL